MKRKFKGQEMVLAVKGLENKKQEKEWIEYQLDYHNLMLSKGLEMNHKKNVRDFKVKKHEFESDLKIVDETLKILESQIRNGVEIKPNVNPEIKTEIKPDVKTEVKGGSE